VIKKIKKTVPKLVGSYQLKAGEKKTKKNTHLFIWILLAKITIYSSNCMLQFCSKKLRGTEDPENTGNNEEECQRPKKLKGDRLVQKRFRQYS
jgi:hypothetical protein